MLGVGVSLEQEVIRRVPVLVRRAVHQAHSLVGVLASVVVHHDEQLVILGGDRRRRGQGRRSRRRRINLHLGSARRRRRRSRSLTLETPPELPPVLITWSRPCRCSRCLSPRETPEPLQDRVQERLLLETCPWSLRPSRRWSRSSSRRRRRRSGPYTRSLLSSTSALLVAETLNGPIVSHSKYLRSAEIVDECKPLPPQLQLS